MLQTEMRLREQKDVSTKGVHEHLTRAYGMVLAINGLYRDQAGKKSETPPLRRLIAFSNTRKISERFAEKLRGSTLRGKASLYVNQHYSQNGRRALKVESRHLDARNSSFERAIELGKLRDIKEEGASRVLCNVSLFSEGVDVPALDAIIFLEPRRSSVDIVAGCRPCHAAGSE